MRAVVEAIARYRAAHGHPPSVRDLKERTAFCSTSVVWYWLRECEDGGLILRERASRGRQRDRPVGGALAGAPSERESPAVGGIAACGHAA